MEVSTYPDWLHPLLSAGNCKSFYTSRGISADTVNPYSGFNVCHYTGDDPYRVKASINELSKVAGIAPNRIIVPTQTHSNHVAVIDRMSYSKDTLDDCDGLVTNQKNVIIGVNTADCLPIVLVDPVDDVIGVAHGGWRGILGGIIENTVSAMHRLGSRNVNIMYSIGPSICADCFEVGPEVASLFPSDVISFPIKNGKPHVDLHRMVIKITEQLGIPRNHEAFQPQSMCTKHNFKKFFSARAMGTKSGRNFTFGMII